MSTLRIAVVLVCTTAIAVTGVTWLRGGTDTTILPSEHPAIDYAKTPVDDPATRLAKKLDSGEVKLDWSGDAWGYLPSLLDNLGIGADSQVLVFSKTSFQAARISPRAPRAIYFNDNSTVGYVQGSDVLELATLDPKQGYIFYTFENTKPERPASQPSIDRRDVCLQCHHGPATSGVPGIMVASVYPDSSGMPAARLGMPVTDHATRFQDRWGGWYVTGTHGGMLHRGNAVARDRKFPDLLETRDTQNVTDLSKRFDTGPYLEKGSDLVALLTLEHQTKATDLIIRAGWSWRIAEADKTEEARKLAASDIDVLADYLLFVDEARLLDKIVGTSSFTQSFAARGLRDSKGRSLRDYDLKTRLFKYPLSYMIYSDAFAALPKPVHDRVMAKIQAVLHGRVTDAKYARFTPELRQAIQEIISDTL